ncbi:MAG: PspC domain-containing protein [Bacteroidetes bacterium]|nr:PspC domain-containing protein [Bacteroidota bacterium]
MEAKRLYRSVKDRVIGGVCGGLGNYFNLDPVLVRVLWAILFFVGGVGFLAYIIAWIIVPEEPGNEVPKS